MKLHMYNMLVIPTTYLKFFEFPQVIKGYTISVKSDIVTTWSQRNVVTNHKFPVIHSSVLVMWIFTLAVLETATMYGWYV